MTEPRLIVDLGSSSDWLSPDTTLPSWLTGHWLTEKNAQLLCELHSAEAMSRLRALISEREKLTAYPRYDELENCLKSGSAESVKSLLVRAMSGTRCIRITPDSDEPTEADFQKIPNWATADSSRKHTLAMVTPLPPDKTGIAFYSAELLQDLQAHYGLTVVVDDPAAVDRRISAQVTLMSLREFTRRGAEFDFVLYHFGNSHFHYDYFNLLKIHPGVVVLHDIYLGDAVISNHEEYGATQLLQSIYSSHGWSAMPDCQDSVQKSIALFPACGEVINDSYGAIVHNRAAMDHLKRFFSTSILDKVSATKLAHRPMQLPDSESARDALGISRSAIVLASFGLINTNKCIDELLEAWERSSLGRSSKEVLCLVGGCDDEALEKKLLDKIARLPNPDSVRVTGFLPQEEYDRYLAAANIAVQLRINSRGESSGAVIDVMSAGLHTIVNKHGSMDEFPDDTVQKVADACSWRELQPVLESACTAVRQNESLGPRALEFITTNHSLSKVARDYRGLLENTETAKLQKLVDNTLQTTVLPLADELDSADFWRVVEQYNDIVRCSGLNRSLPTARQLLIDVSAVVQHDLKSGIQRAVRNILRELLLNQATGFRVEAIYYDFETEQFRYARTFVNAFLELNDLNLFDDVVETCRGDLYLGLDLYYVIAGRPESRSWFHYWQGRGVRVANVIYDILPLQLPECFPPDQHPLFNDWLHGITEVSDSIMCISRAVADQYSEWLEENRRHFQSVPAIGAFHLGADMETHRVSSSSRGKSGLASELAGQRYLLMVGTVEPRKGHAQTLDAFTTLWNSGSDVALVIVGRTGWVEGDLVDRLKEAETRYANLYWPEFVSDDELVELYQHATGTLMASLGEGFGLPLIEAASHGCPILARDLPVFREVCGDNAWYFSADDKDQLAASIGEWLELEASGNAPTSQGMRWIDWATSSRQLLDGAMGQKI